MKNSFYKTFLIFFFCFLISIPLIIPYFKSGFFPTHDGEWAVVRLSEMYREIKDLQIPARFSGYLNFEYGYPLFNFTYPMPYYIGLIFVFLKLGFVGSIKILFASSVVLSAFFMFLLSESLWKSKFAGIVSSILYIYVPYRIVDLYVRGSLGESLAFVIFPLIALGILGIYRKRTLNYVIFTGLMYAILITTHNIMAVLFSVFIFLIFLSSILVKNIKFSLSLFFSMLVSFGISAFFWIPAIFEKNLILLSKVPIAERSLNFIKPLDIIIPRWGYGVPTDINGFNFQIGLPQMIVVILAVFLIIKKKKENIKILFFLILSIVAFSVLLFPQSALIWENTPFLSEINFPWTILGILMFLISLASGFITKNGKIFTFTVLILAFFSIVLVTPYAKPQSHIDRGDEYYLTNQGTTTSSNELMPLWVKEFPINKADRKVESIDGEIRNLSYDSRSLSFTAEMKRDGAIRLNRIYYPGWSVYVDGIKTSINYNNKFGLMDVNLKKGEHLVKATLTETSLRAFSNAVSVFSLIISGLALMLLRNYKIKLK